MTDTRPVESITEASGVHQQWYEDAKGQTLESLPAFLSHLLEDYGHDYGTICHALAAGSIATAWAMNRHESGGITGFQAGAVMWQFMKGWQGYEAPLRLTNYADLLYPQYAYKFAPTISPETWEWAQEEARKQLAAHPEIERKSSTTMEGKAFSYETPHPNVHAHWVSIAAGEVPFGLTVADQ